MSNISFTQFYNIIGDSKRSATSFHYGVDPSTKEPLWEVPIASEDDVNEAVATAKDAFRSWSNTPMDYRKDKMKEFIKLWKSHTEDFIALLRVETGKPRGLAEGEVLAVADFLGEPLDFELPVEVFEDDTKIVQTSYTPLGVCVGICPWNFPLALASGKIGPAITAGNTILIKPSPYTPYTALKMIELMQTVFPCGVVQVLGGTDSLGPLLTSHPDVAKVSFTGSIATGKKIMKACAGSLKRITLELGGNDATIVLPDVDISTVAPEVVKGAFVNSGQVCVATKRVYIHRSIYKPFVKAMVQYTEELTSKFDQEDDAIIGPIQNEMQFKKVKEFYEDCKVQGYKFAIGDSQPEESSGYSINPAIIDNPPNGARIVQEEPFGPIVPCQPWDDTDEVIARANDTNTGLGACVWSGNAEKAKEVGNRLEAGSVFINSFEKVHPKFFFSGHKESGIGGEWGRRGLLSYCNSRVTHVYK